MKSVLGDLAERKASVYIMKKDKTIFNLSLVFLLTLSAYFLADTVDAVIGRSLEAAPVSAPAFEKAGHGIEPKKELSDYMRILERGLFGDGKGPSSVTAAPSSLFKLIGTVEGDSFSGAVLEDSTGTQNFYRLREKLADGSQIAKITRDKVVLKLADGSAVELQVSDDTKIVDAAKPDRTVSGIRRVSTGRFMVDQGIVTSSTENLSQLLTQARALPYIENGKTAGFRITEIVPGSIYEKIGLQNGDVIQRINSQDVDDPGKFFQMYQGLKEEKNITVDVIRNGQRQTFTYEIR